MLILFTTIIKHYNLLCLNGQLLILRLLLLGVKALDTGIFIYVYLFLVRHISLQVVQEVNICLQAPTHLKDNKIQKKLCFTVFGGVRVCQMVSGGVRRCPTDLEKGKTVRPRVIMFSGFWIKLKLNFTLVNSCVFLRLCIFFQGRFTRFF